MRECYGSGGEEFARRAYAFLAPLIGKIPEGFTAKELAVLGVISFCLCLVNIV